MNNERLKIVFGFCLLLELGALATIVGLGKVEMQTSYGLNIILGSLATLSGMFAQWAFGSVNGRTGQSDAGRATVAGAPGTGGGPSGHG